MRTPVDSGMARKDNLPLVVETRPLPSPPTQKSEHHRRSWHPVLWWFGRHTCLLNHFIYQQLVVCLWFQVSLPKTSGTDSKHGKHCSADAVGTFAEYIGMCTLVWGEGRPGRGRQEERTTERTDRVWSPGSERGDVIRLIFTRILSVGVFICFSVSSRKLWFYWIAARTRREGNMICYFFSRFPLFILAFLLACFLAAAEHEEIGGLVYLTTLVVTPAFLQVFTWANSLFNEP